jgi:predicted dehydrogenase
MTNIASIGIGWQGGGNLGQFLGCNGSKVVAVCDVDEGHLNNAAKQVNDRYKNTDCKKFKDYRELLQMKDLDAVAISTPDHWHSIPAVAAANAKKDIFCEKPLSHTLAEGIAMVDAVQKNQRIWQTGSWQRSGPDFRRAALMVVNGYVGKVTRVEVGLPSGHSDFAGTKNNQPNGNPPAGVDYDFWIGPAQMMPFNPCRFHKNWRWNYNTGGGQLMDWIGHHCDIAHWGLSNPKYGCAPDDQVGPLELTAKSEFPPKDAVWNTATKFRIECKYPNNVDVVIAGGHGDIQGGAKWIGPNGWVYVTRGKFECSDKSWLNDIIQREKTKKDLEMVLLDSRGHMQQFIDSCKSRQKTLTPVEVAHRSQTPGHLGLIASRTGRKLTWNAAKQEIVGDPEATKMLSKEFRKPWQL